MLASIKRMISDFCFYTKEWKIQRQEAKEVERIEDENWSHPMICYGAYKDMQHHHEERVRQHKIDKMNIV